MRINRKIGSIVLTFLLSLSTLILCIGQSNAIIEPEHEDTATAQMDQEIKILHERIHQNYIDNLQALSSVQLNDSELTKKTDQIKQDLLKEARQEEHLILKKYGFESVDQDDDNPSEVTPLSYSSAVTMDDLSISYDRTTRLWRYSGSFDWFFPLDQPYDTLFDTEDIMSVSITDDTNFTYMHSLAYIYDATGDNSGTVYSDGSNTYGSNITLRNHSVNGVLYNVIDIFEGFPNECKADRAIIVAYFKKTGGFGQPVSTKIFTTYHHNFKYNFLNWTACINFASLKEIGGALSVTYDLFNGVWQKSSGGILITDPR
ncbi:MAG TPA: hypothetical protein DCM45_06050 [Clostridiales bacterium]|nr:hypothetical protein [Clostridiales bacterium]